MKAILALLVISLLVFQKSQSQDSTVIHTFSIGETKVSVEEQCFSPCESNIVFIHLHDNEKTSLEAAHHFLLENGGRLIRLVNDSQRNVLVVINNKECCFDPNRIYSTIGIQESLLSLTEKYPSIAEEKVALFSHAIRKQFITEKNLIVSLHNNSDTLYSIAKIKEDILNNRYAGNYFINEAMDVDDFVLTSDTTIYNQMVAKNINVVWENATAIPDDGSLSIYAGKKKIPYINIETQHEHLQEQLDLLQALKDIIIKYKNGSQ